MGIIAVENGVESTPPVCSIWHIYGPKSLTWGTHPIPCYDFMWPRKILNFRGYNHINAVNGPNMRGVEGVGARKATQLPTHIIEVCFIWKETTFYK